MVLISFREITSLSDLLRAKGYKHDYKNHTANATIPKRKGVTLVTTPLSTTSS